MAKQQENKKKKSKFDHWYLLTNTDGKKSISFTMVFFGFGAVTLWLLLSMAEQLLGINIREFSGSEAMMFLSPIFAIYFGRKQQNGSNNSNNSVNLSDSTDEESSDNK